MTSAHPIDPTLNFEAAYAKWASHFVPLGFFPCMDSTICAMAFLHELKGWNKKINLVADASDEEWVLNHLLDSAMPLKMKALENATFSARAIDVGTGGGFPGVPLAFVRPLWSMTLVDSIQKKLAALDQILAKFPFPSPDKGKGSDRFRTLAGRAETFAKEPEHRETYDLAFCRAVGELSSILEFTLPFLKVGGSCFLHRGADIDQDIIAAERALGLLGGQVEDNLSYKLPHRDKQHHILQIKKISPTPAEYPRRPGVPDKKPL